MKTPGQNAYEGWAKAYYGQSYFTPWNQLSSGQRANWDLSAKTVLLGLWKPVSTPPAKDRHMVVCGGTSTKHVGRAGVSKWSDRYSDRTHWFDPRDIPTPPAPVAELSLAEQAFIRSGLPASHKESFLAGARALCQH